MDDRRSGDLSERTYPGRDAMADLDRVAVEEAGLPILAMMESAGRHLARTVLEQGSAPYVVLCGKGNNGGGGLCAVRYLANRLGDESRADERDEAAPGSGDVVACLSSPADELAPAAATQLDVLEAAGVPVREAGRLPEAGTYVDALLGYNADGAPRPPLGDLVAAVDDASATRISLDLPTGLDATTGEASGAVVDADHTVTLACLKRGLVQARGPDVAGQVVVCDIGIPAAVYAEASLDRPAFDDRGQWIPGDVTS